MLLYIAFFLIALVILLRYAKSMYWSFLLLIVAKPIIDVTWNMPGGLIALAGAIVPIIYFPVVKYKLFISWKIPWNKLALILMLSMISGFVVIGLGTRFMDSMETIFKAFNIYFAFFLFVYLFDHPQRFKNLLLAMLVMGLFTTIMSLYQGVTGVVWNKRETIGLVRQVGMYHDSFPIRFYSFMTLIAILLYWLYFAPRKLYVKLLLLGYSMAVIYALFYTYTKAGYSILALWFVSYIIFFRSFTFAAIVGIALFAVTVFTGDDIFDKVYTVFTKEVEYQTGELKDDRYVLAGRGFIWEKSWQKYKNANLLTKIIGEGRSYPVHNEWLRILLANGIIGIIIYAMFFFYIVFVLVKNINKNKPLSIIAIMLMSMYIIDCVGLVPGEYYHYHWFLWGFIGLSFSKIGQLNLKEFQQKYRELNATAHTKVRLR